MVNNIVFLVSFSPHFTFNETLNNLKENPTNSSDKIFTIGFSNSFFKHDLDVNPKLSTLKKFILVSKFLNYFSQKQTRKKKVKLVFISSGFLNLLLIFRFMRAFHIFHVIHDFKPHSGEKNYLKILIYNHLIVLLCDIITHSKYTSNQILFSYKNIENKITLLPLTRYYGKVFTYNPSLKKVLLFGRLNYYKGLNLLPFLIYDNPDIEFIFAGKIDFRFVSYFDKNIKVFRNATIIDRVIAANEMEQIFTSCNLVILPYIDASQSGVIVDAYKFGLPVVAFDVGALSEQIVHDSTGFLIYKNDSKNFSNALKKFYNLDSKTKIGFSNNARHFGYRNYSSELNSKKFFDGLNIKK